MPVINHDLTSNGLRVGMMVQLNEEFFNKRGLTIPNQRPALLLIKITGQKVEVLFEKGEIASYFWVNLDELEEYVLPLVNWRK